MNLHKTYDQRNKKNAIPPKYQSINQFISSHTTDIHNLQNQSNENIHIMCNEEYPRSLNVTFVHKIVCIYIYRKSLVSLNIAIVN